MPIQRGKRRLTGIQPTGSLHIGNYFGAIKPFLRTEKDTELILFVANYHSLTAQRNPKNLLHDTYDIAATLLALGLDLEKTMFFCQSDIPEVVELSWILSCVTGMGLLERAHAFKDSVSRGKDASAGLFYYPVLMAADILLYDADEVPVGKDQQQHLEMTRDMAGAFNHLYGDIFRIPKTVVQEDAQIVCGLDGQKMSKSYHNTVAIFEDENVLKKKIMGIPTDSTPLEAPKKADGTVLFELYQLFGSSTQSEDFKSRLMAGGMGWGHAKKELFEVIWSFFAPFRKRYLELRNETAVLDRVFEQGAQKARAIAEPKIKELRKAIGLRQE